LATEAGVRETTGLQAGTTFPSPGSLAFLLLETLPLVVGRQHQESSTALRFEPSPGLRCYPGQSPAIVE